MELKIADLERSGPSERWSPGRSAADGRERKVSRMHGMVDSHARVAFARERAQTLRDVMRTSRRDEAKDDGAGRRGPARQPAASPALRPSRVV
jgi:hypothetical protein